MNIRHPRPCLAQSISCLFMLVFILTLPVYAESVPGEIIVKLSRPAVRSLDDAIVSTRVAVIDQLVISGAASLVEPLRELSRDFPEIASIVELRMTGLESADSIAALLSLDSGIEWASPNHVFRTYSSLDDIPDDSLVSAEWWLSKISTFDAWNITRGDTSIVIGIIDTGIDYLHPDLIGNLWHNRADDDSNGVDDDNNGFIDDRIGWDFVDSPAFPAAGDHTIRDNDPMEQPGLARGHGTFVAGLAGAVTNNGECMAGVGYNCRIMALRAGNGDGLLEEDDIAAAILYGAANGANVINMSFGDVVVSPLLREAVQLAHAAGVVQVASAGNANSQSIHYPSGFPEVIAIGATDELDRRAGFSNFGPAVELMAPGYHMLSTFADSGCGEWIYPNGTSYAAPIVAAAAALVLSVNPALSPDDVTQLLRSTTDDLRGEGWDTESAHGRLNLRRAVEQAAYGSDIVARIATPITDQGLIDDFWVTGEAWGAAFDSYELSYGLGENPLTWTIVTYSRDRTYDAPLGFIELPPQDTVLNVKLEAIGAGGQHVVDFRHLYVQRSAPVIDSVNITQMLDRDTYGDLVQVWTNQVTTASFILTNAVGDSVREDFGYVADNHTGFLSPEVHPGSWMFQIRLQNQADLVTYSAPYTFEITDPPINRNLWSHASTILPRGYFGSFSTDHDCDGNPELWLWPIGSELVTPQPLQPYEWNGSDFVETGNTYGGHIPRAIGDADDNSLIEMMGVNGGTTRIWTQSISCGVLDSVIFEQEQNFFGSGFYEIDGSDPGTEIIARKSTARDSISRDRLIIYNVSADYILSVFDTLPNNTEGGNGLGHPKVLVGDLDADGATDIVYGDYDGDIIFCEQEGEHFAQRWSIRLPLEDATSWFDAGDFDGDGSDELLAGCRGYDSGGSESQIKSRRWEYYFLDVTGDNSFTVTDTIFILGNEDVTRHPAACVAADVDADGRDEALISAYPDFYLFEFDQGSARYRPVWYSFPCESNTFLVTDWNANGVREFFFSDGTNIVRAEAEGVLSTRPLPPSRVFGQPLSEHDVLLTWSPVAGADSYRVYSASNPPDFFDVAQTTDTFFALIELPEDELITYAITSVDFAYPNRESVLSNYTVAAANRAPSSQDTAQFIEPHFVSIRFSEAMGETALRQWLYRLDDTSFPSVISSEEGNRVLVLSFDDSLAIGWHHISMSELRDAQNSRLPDTESVVVFEVRRIITNAPVLLSHRHTDPPIGTHVEIVFSSAMNESVLNPANFQAEAPYHVLAVASAASDHHIVNVTMDPSAPVGATGRTARIRLRNLFSADGVALDTTAGRADVVIGESASNLAAAYVYPNPYDGTVPAEMTFAALPEQAKIRIFDLRGVLVREILHHNSGGGTAWDLTNSDNERVSSGIYIFTIESAGESKRGKLAVLR